MKTSSFLTVSCQTRVQLQFKYTDLIEKLRSFTTFPLPLMIQKYHITVNLSQCAYLEAQSFDSSMIEVTQNRIFRTII